MNPTTTNTKTQPWRVQVPGRYFADGKRKGKYFKTKEAAEEFCRRVKKFGRAVFNHEPSTLAETHHYGAIVNESDK